MDLWFQKQKYNDFGSNSYLVQFATLLNYFELFLIDVYYGGYVSSAYTSRVIQLFLFHGDPEVQTNVGYRESIH